MDRNHARRVLLAFVGLLALTALTARADEPAPARTLRLATFNIHHAEGADGRLDLDRVAGLVREADLVAFQEVDVRFGARSRFVDQAEALGRALGAAHVFGPNLVRGDAQYGVALVSRLPIRSSRNHRLPHAPGREQAEPRGLLEAVVEVDGRPLRVYATHLSHDSRPERLLQVDRIRSVIQAGTGEFLLMGDLNFRPGSEEHDRLFRPADGSGADAPWVVDAWARVGQGDGPTIGLDGDHAARIDYILVSPGLAPGLESARVDTETVASDHQPLFATLRLPASP